MTDHAAPAVLTVLCIPGPWRSRTDLIAALISSNSGYLFAGQLLMNVVTKHSCELDFQPADPRMEAAFRAAGPHWAGTPEMQRIASHASVAYLVADGGGAMTAEALMQAANALLDAGGLGVKVESSGVAHAPAAWRELCADLHLFSAQRAYVLYVTGEQVYSCGMHNLGLRDAIVENDGDTAEAVELLRVFTRYLFTESPAIRAGQTFGAAEDAPVYRLLDDPGPGYEEGSLYANPFGFWRLVRAR
jgi:hypothetical protein